jgi:hypothetical protein
MPGMCLAVVAVAAMSVVGRGSATAMVEEAATAAAEEADDGRGGRGLTWFIGNIRYIKKGLTICNTGQIV